METNGSHVDVNESYGLGYGSIIADRDHHVLPVVICLCFVGLTGAVGNAIVAIVGLKKQQKTSAQYYIISLSSVDFMVCTVVIPLEIYNLTNEYNFSNNALCKTYIWLSDFTIYTSFLIHVAVAVDRYWVMRTVRNIQPQMHRFFFSKTVSFSQVSIWAIVVTSGSISILGCVGYESVQLLSGTDLYACTNTRFTDLGYVSSWIRSCLSFFSIFAMCILYLALFCGLARKVGFSRPSRLISDRVMLEARPEDSTRDTAGGGETSADSSHGTRTDGGMPSVETNVQTTHSGAASRQTGTKSRASPSGTVKINHQGAAAWQQTVPTERRGRSQQSPSGQRSAHRTRLNSRNGTHNKVYRSAKLLALITGVFILTWLPEWVVHFLLQIDINLYHRLMVSNHLDLTESVLCLRFINNAANPIIFLFLNGEFRQDCKKLVSCVRRSE